MNNRAQRILNMLELGSPVKHLTKKDCDESGSPDETPRDLGTVALNYNSSTMPPENLLENISQDNYAEDLNDDSTNSIPDSQPDLGFSVLDEIDSFSVLNIPSQKRTNKYIEESDTASQSNTGTDFSSDDIVKDPNYSVDSDDKIYSDLEEYLYPYNDCSSPKPGPSRVNIFQRSAIVYEPVESNSSQQQLRLTCNNSQSAIVIDPPNYDITYTYPRIPNSVETPPSSAYIENPSVEAIDEAGVKKSRKRKAHPELWKNLYNI
ncbi:unnamed protein product [Parnassius mnemosyne]|uniref:Uncharacterized protein n=1 Tax=Parnassius mnemosyne TaxID=213953 RepID=A0AAV1KRE1_9NEOP